MLYKGQPFCRLTGSSKMRWHSWLHIFFLSCSQNCNWRINAGLTWNSGVHNFKNSNFSIIMHIFKFISTSLVSLNPLFALSLSFPWPSRSNFDISEGWPSVNRSLSVQRLFFLMWVWENIFHFLFPLPTSTHTHTTTLKYLFPLFFGNKFKYCLTFCKID